MHPIKLGQVSGLDDSLAEFQAAVNFQQFEEVEGEAVKLTRDWLYSCRWIFSVVMTQGMMRLFSYFLRQQEPHSQMKHHRVAKLLAAIVKNLT